MGVIYEWDVETVSLSCEDEEILGHNHRDRLSEYGPDDFNPEDWGGDRCDLVLVRDGDDERLWAYVKDDKLPEFFHDAWQQPTGYAVPKRFHQELERHFKRAETWQ